jgi:hypothetical protein
MRDTGWVQNAIGVPSRGFIYISIVTIVASLGNTFTAYSGAVLVGLYAWLSPVNILRSILLVWLPGMLSVAIFPAAAEMFSAKFITLACIWVTLLSSGLARRRVMDPSQRKLALATGGLVIILLVHSLVASRIPDVSFLKITLFFSLLYTSAVAWKKLNSVQKQQFQNELRFLLTGVLLGSAPLLISPIGFLRNSTGFQGILSNPPLLGLFAAIGIAIQIPSLIDKERKWRFLIGLIVVVELYELFRSESRTAGLALILSLFLWFPISIFGNASKNSGHSKRRSITLLSIFAACGFFLLYVGGNAVETYATKGGRSNERQAIALYAEARGGLLENMQENIRENPWLGIGFGVPSTDDYSSIIRITSFNVPVSASTEKGNIFMAIIEEMGYPIAILIFAWLISSLRSVMRASFEQLLPLFVLIMANLGEAMFFSANGFGLLSCLLLGSGYSSIIESKKQDWF